MLAPTHLKTPSSYIGFRIDRAIIGMLMDETLIMLIPVCHMEQIFPIICSQKVTPPIYFASTYSVVIDLSTLRSFLLIFLCIPIPVISLQHAIFVS